jgi:hypothetical protein
MNTFQYIAMSVTGVLVITSGLNFVRNLRHPLVPFFWFVLWGAASTAIAVPNSTTYIANAFGIVRGADFVSYCGVLAGLFGFSLVYIRFRHLDRQLTLMVRELAFTQVRLERPQAWPDDSAPAERGADGPRQ